MNGNGISEYRFAQNPAEKIFIEEWLSLNKVCKTVEYLMSDHISERRAVSPEEMAITNRIIQWLGSPCGQAFLNDVSKRTKVENCQLRCCRESASEAMKEKSRFSFWARQ